jgi:hypothetical protein
VVIASEDAIREYWNKIHVNICSPKFELEVCKLAMRNTMTSCRSKEFEKLFAVAYPTNGYDFVKQFSSCTFDVF